MDECISRKAALELLSQPITMSMCLSTDECHHKIAQRRIDCYLIEQIPAADVRPVVRGKWVEYYEPYSTGEEWAEAQYGYECSICGRWEYEKEPFCNCGAEMREES